MYRVHDHGGAILRAGESTRSPETSSRINASIAARDPVCWLGSEARVHSDVRCHMWQLKSRTVLVVAAFLGTSCGGGMSGGPTAPTAAPDQRLSASASQPVPAAVRPSAGPPGISSDPSGRLPDGNRAKNCQTESADLFPVPFPTVTLPAPVPTVQFGSRLTEERDKSSGRIRRWQIGRQIGRGDCFR
jgi:hypothetical protein